MLGVWTLPTLDMDLCVCSAGRWHMEMTLPIRCSHHYHLSGLNLKKWEGEILQGLDAQTTPVAMYRTFCWLKILSQALRDLFCRLNKLCRPARQPFKEYLSTWIKTVRVVLSQSWIMSRPGAESQVCVCVCVCVRERERERQTERERERERGREWEEGGKFFKHCIQHFVIKRWLWVWTGNCKAYLSNLLPVGGKSAILPDEDEVIKDTGVKLWERGSV